MLKRKNSFSVSLLCYLSSNFTHILLQRIPSLSHSQRLSPSGYCVKVTPKKGKATNLKAIITVKNPTISAPATAEVTVGATASVAATAKPAGAIVSYASDNTAVATVDANGVVTGVAEGTAKITATVKSGSVKKTATTTVTVVDPAAKKIASVTATSVKTLEVKFDGIVKDAATGTFKVSRAGTDVAMTAKWAADNKCAVLTSEASLQAGTYTVAYGEMSGTVIVTAQKATKINILTTKVGLGVNLGSQQRIYYTVLDQYGNDMGIASNKLTITATNMNKNNSMDANIDTNSNKTNTYFDLLVDPAPTNSIGDKIAVVAYLTTDVSVNVSATLEIANIYTKTFTFGEPDKAKDTHIYVDKTDYSYSLPYTATDSEGNKVLLEKTRTTLGTPATTNNITFVSSNPSTIDPDSFKIDSDGKITFKTGSYASTVTITALNTVTGETSSVNITVGKKPSLSKVEITDVTVHKGFTAGEKVKAEIVGYDQYGTVIPAANMANLDLSSYFTFTGSACAAGTTAKVTKDGKYVELANLNSVLASAAIGAKFNVTFISKTDATLSSTATIIIGDATIASYFKIDSSAVDTLFAGATGTLKVTVYDNYDQVMTNGFVVSATTTGKVSVDIGTGEWDAAAKQTKYTVNGLPVSGTAESGTIDLLLKDASGNEVENKSVNVNVSNTVSKLIVSTDKTSYASGDKINVEIKAYNGQDFLSNLNTTLAVTVASYNEDGTAVDSKVENLTFKNGVATTTLDAKAAVKSVGVAVKSAIATGNNDIAEVKVEDLSVNASSTTTKYGVAVSGSAITITAQNSVGETVTGYAGNKAITVKVEKKTALGTSDVTDSFIASADKNSIKNFVAGKLEITPTTQITAETDVIYIITVSEQGSKITGSAEIK